MSRIRAARSKIKLFWSWVNYVWLHFCTVRKDEWRLLWLCGYWAPKTCFSWRNQVAVTLSQLSKDVSIVPSFWNVFLEILWANSVHMNIFAVISGCFYWASSEYWEVKSIRCSVCIVFRHCECKNSRETIRCEYRAKLKQH